MNQRTKIVHGHGRLNVLDTLKNRLRLYETAIERSDEAMKSPMFRRRARGAPGSRAAGIPNYKSGVTATPHSLE